MKNFHIKYFLLCISVVYFLASCETRKSSVEAHEPYDIEKIDGQILQVDTSLSLVAFTGRKTLLGTEHDGFFRLAKGQLIINQDKIQGGEFIIEMNSLTITGLDDQAKNQLAMHLKSKDFFDVKTYPIGNFIICSIKESRQSDFSHLIKGNLTIHGITKGIVFPANITKHNHKFVTSANFYINRKDWNIFYNKENSFKDKIISGQVAIKLNIASIQYL